MHQQSTTFEQHIEILAMESPCALILEWGRRLELAVKNFGRVVGASKGSCRKYIEAILNDPLIGGDVVSEINCLRSRRNEVAHEQPKCIATEEAIQFARKVEEIVWFLGRAEGVRVGRRF